jgi:hypothetical protein
MVHNKTFFMQAINEDGTMVKEKQWQVILIKLYLKHWIINL